MPVQRHGGAHQGKADNTGPNLCHRPREAELPSLWSELQQILSEQSPCIVAMEAVLPVISGAALLNALAIMYG